MELHWAIRTSSRLLCCGWLLRRSLGRASQCDSPQTEYDLLWQLRTRMVILMIHEVPFLSYTYIHIYTSASCSATGIHKLASDRDGFKQSLLKQYSQLYSTATCSDTEAFLHLLQSIGCFHSETDGHRLQHATTIWRRQIQISQETYREIHGL